MKKRSIDIQDNIDNFDKDIGISNEQDKIRHYFFDILLLISILNI